MSDSSLSLRHSFKLVRDTLVGALSVVDLALADAAVLYNFATVQVLQMGLQLDFVVITPQGTRPTREIAAHVSSVASLSYYLCPERITPVQNTVYSVAVFGFRLIGALPVSNKYFSRTRTGQRVDSS
jgi:hypothetical protein